MPTSQETTSHKVNNTESGPSDSDYNTEKKAARDCFFKVIDLRNDGQGVQTQGECYFEGGLDEFYKTVPAQDSDTIRIILDGRRFAEPKNENLFESQRYEKTPVGFILDRSIKEKLQVICFAPNAHVSAPRINAYEFVKECSSASWRWLEGIDRVLGMPHLLTPLSNGDQTQTLRLLLLNLLSVTMARNVAFLEETTGETELDEFDPKLVGRVTRTEFAERIGGWALLFRRIEDDITYLNSSIECLLKRVRRHDISASNDPSSPLAQCLEDMTIDGEFHKYQASQRRIRYSELFDVLSYRVTAKQANSVSQLTLLAAFFLPMSLASAILSMQSRFMDLHLVLYDFVGVVIILGTIAATAYAVFKWGPDLYEKIIRMNYGDNISESRKLFRALKFICLAAWWLAILTAFLVGMLKDPVLGMKIFGFEAAGITGVWILSLKGVRMAYSQYRQREKGKQQKQQAHFPGANVSSW
ncbi:hypothetical protein N0V90_012688 [Kalmusia sp. IMI 367209]|nr:hypothetical protein N0V90_012688 [Kalmusia sp. IMI 367209]